MRQRGDEISRLSGLSLPRYLIVQVLVTLQPVAAAASDGAVGCHRVTPLSLSSRPSPIAVRDFGGESKCTADGRPFWGQEIVWPKMIAEPLPCPLYQRRQMMTCAQERAVTDRMRS